jgi:hypothetical protein
MMLQSFKFFSSSTFIRTPHYRYTMLVLLAPYFNAVMLANLFYRRGKTYKRHDLRLKLDRHLLVVPNHLVFPTT